MCCFAFGHLQEDFRGTVPPELTQKEAHKSGWENFELCSTFQKSPKNWSNLDATKGLLTSQPMSSSVGSIPMSDILIWRSWFSKILVGLRFLSDETFCKKNIWCFSCWLKGQFLSCYKEYHLTWQLSTHVTVFCPIWFQCGNDKALSREMSLFLTAEKYGLIYLWWIPAEWMYLSALRSW